MGSNNRCATIFEVYNVYDAGGSLAHIDAVTDNKKTEYITGPMGTLARVTNGSPTFLHPDHLGSAQSGTNSTGGVTWREQYTPFGEELQSPAANDNLGGFTGHIRDKATGLNYMQARYYDPVIGRFLSVDPVGFTSSGGNPGYFNRYAYTFNDPINMIDPTGMIVEGTGFDEGEFERVEEDAQTASDAAGAAAEALSDLRSAIKNGGDLSAAQQSHKSQFESVFGVGSATTKNLKRASSYLSQTSDALDSDSDLVFNKPTAAQSTIDFGGSPGGALAYAFKGEINVLPGYFSYDKSKSSFLIGHEGIHIAKSSGHIPKSLIGDGGTTGSVYRTKAIKHWAGSQALFKDAGVLDCYVGASC